MTTYALAYQVADSIDVKNFKSSFPSESYYEEPDEVFYEIPEGKLVYIFKYGVVCFLNYDESGISEFMQLVSPFCTNIFPVKLNEKILVETGTAENKFGYNKVELQSSKINALRIVMLHVSQSVALDYYYEQTSRLLLETQHYTQQLEQKGKLDISGKKLTRFIGKTLNLKNKIAENLYVFDSPDVTWEDESLNKIDMGIKNTFDIQVRFRNVEEGLVIVKENLDLFKDLMQHRKSLALEWIIIILILVEVINLAAEKIFTK